MPVRSAVASDATVFHSTAWAQVLSETYGHQPRYCVTLDGGGSVLAGVPAFLVSSRLTGRRLVGAPFSDLCPPLVRDGENADGLAEGVLRDARRQGASYVEIRGSAPLPLEDAGFKDSPWFMRYVVPLGPPLGEIVARMHDSARRGVRKSERAGLEVRCSTSLDDLRRFYDLHVATRRGHGVPPQPYRFFERIHAHFFARERGYLLLASVGDRVVAGDLLLRNHRSLVYKFNASDSRFLEMRPNNALMWAAIQLGKRLDCQTLDLGRCEADNDGLRRFKLLWGAQELPLPYYYYPDVRGVTAMSQRRWASGLMAAAVRLAPRSLMEPASRMLYRHLG